jgi:hypothetical protein
MASQHSVSWQNDMADFYKNDGGDDQDIFGTPVVATFDFNLGIDYERLVMSLEAEHAKIMLIRFFGMRGKEAARLVWLTSEWALYRREHELQRTLERQREHYIG